MTDDEWDRQLAEERHASHLPPRDEVERHLMNEMLIRDHDPADPFGPPQWAQQSELTAAQLAEREADHEFADGRAGEPPRNDAEREQYREWRELDPDVLADQIEAQRQDAEAGVRVTTGYGQIPHGGRNMNDTEPQPVRPGEVADLLGWCSSLMRTSAADPAEVAAYQAAKADLLERIAETRASDPDLADRARQAATAARATLKETAPDREAGE